MAIDFENDTTSDVRATELWRIAESGEVRGLENILGKCVDINATNAEGVTALMRAASRGHSEMVEALVGRGADVNLVRSDGFNALTLAAFFGHGDVVQILVEHGADPAMGTRWGTSADMWASARSFPAVAEYLGRARGKTNDEDASAIAVQPDAPANDEELSLQAENSDEELVVREEDQEPVSRESRNQIEEELMAEADFNHEVDDEEITLTGKAYTANNDWTGPVLSAAAIPLALTPKLTVQQPVVHHLKAPPDIWDLVPEQPANFQVGPTFVSRVTADNSKLFMLTLAVMLVCGVATFGILKLSQARRNQPEVQSQAEHHEPPSAVMTQTPAATAVEVPAEKSAVEKPADPAAATESREPAVAENRKPEENNTATKPVEASETAAPKIAAKANAGAKYRPPTHAAAKHANVSSADPARKVTASATVPAQVVGNGETRPRLVHARNSDSQALKADETRSPQSRSETLSSKVIGSAPKTSANSKSKVIRWP